METFNANNTTCPWDGTSFQPGEQGMKCIRCSAIMKLQSWQEKQYCRACDGREAIPVRAVSSNGRISTRRIGSRWNNTITSRTTVDRQGNTSSNIPPTRFPNSSSSLGSLTSSNSSFTNNGSSSHTQSSSSSSGWGCAAILCILLGLGWCITQLGSFSNNHLIQTPQPQLTPKEVITKYYQFATSNPVSSRALVSDTLKSYWKEKNQGNATKSFFAQFQKVDVYSFQTLTQSSNNLKIRVWLKYVTKNNKASCESQIMELIFDQSKGQWLIDKVSDVKYANCGK